MTGHWRIWTQALSACVDTQMPAAITGMDSSAATKLMAATRM
uniref:Uncharacterized protein n=1 Tax=Arundo donax TaxID=35708 RepID=A0A0A9FVN6_ARUDO